MNEKGALSKLNVDFLSDKNRFNFLHFLADCLTN